MSDSSRPHRGQPTRLRHSWDSPGKNTGVGCHFLLQCMKVKSENEVAQSCPTLRDPMDCSLLGSSIHGIFQARVLEWDATAFSFFPNRCQNRDFPSGPVARTPPSQCRDLGSIPLVRELGPTCHNQDSARILKISLAAMKTEDPVCPN